MSVAPVTGDMPVAEFRREAHRAVEWVADFLERLEQLPVTSAAQPGDVLAALPAAAPEHGESIGAVLADLDRVILPGMTHWGHPGFHAYFCSSSSGPGILGELIAAALNPNCMTWRACPAGTELEQATLVWLRDLLGLPAALHGVMFDGASTSSFHALAAAREAAGLDIRERGMAGRPDLPPLRVYGSAEAHSSIEKAVVALGLGRAGYRTIPVDGAQRLRPDLLARAIARDRAAGATPLAVVATVGTTGTTAIDPVAEIAEICRREGLWLHVDAAYGGSAAVVPERRAALAGWDQADSIVVNPHKWLFVPLDLSVLYTRRPDALRRAFALVPEYLRDGYEGRVENYMDYGIPLGRRFRALKLWLVLRYFGRAGLAARVREHLRLAAELAAWVDADPRFERVAPVPLSTVCFRLRAPHAADAGDDLNRRLLDAVNRTREVFLTHTELEGRFVLRLVVGGIRTEQRHVERAWALVRQAAAGLVAA
jgi:aromatic-L-amino-acid decarboxylase